MGGPPVLMSYNNFKLWLTYKEERKLIVAQTDNTTQTQNFVVSHLIELLSAIAIALESDG